MSIGLILELLKLSMSIFHDERKDRFLKKHLKLEKDWHDEMSLPDDQRSDLVLDKLMLECNQLASLVVSESSRKR